MFHFRSSALHIILYLIMVRLAIRAGRRADVEYFIHQVKLPPPHIHNLASANEQLNGQDR